jgi:hypothetical protein
LTTPALAAYAGWTESYPADLASERIETRRIEAMSELAEWCERNAAYSRIVLPPEVADIRPFVWRGWRTEVRYTYRVNLLEHTRSLYRTSLRRNLETAQAAGLRSVVLTGAGAVLGLQQTVRATFRRQNETLPLGETPWSQYLESLTRLATVEILGVLHGEVMVATVAVGYDQVNPGDTAPARSCAYELIAGTTNEGATLGASAFAMSSALELASQRAVEFDFAGANIPTIAHYKHGFGGRLVPYFGVEWARTRTARFVAKTAPILKSHLRRAFQRGVA